MTRMWSEAAAVLAAVFLGDAATAQRGPAPFVLEEATMAQIQAALRSHQLTCRSLVDAYLKRIEAYDKQGPSLNAIVVINSNATRDADELDRRLAQTGP